MAASRAFRFAPMGALLVSMALGSLVSCSRDKRKPQALAELVEIVEGQASRREAKTEWSPASAGNSFFEGAALRTDDVGVARLKFAGELLRMGPATTVFFGKKTLDFDGEIEVGEGVMELGLDFGEAEITTTGRVRLVKHQNSLQFEVLVGEATITEGGEVTVAEPGQQLAFEIGVGVMESEADEPVDAGVPDAPAIDASEVDAAVAEPATGVVATVKGTGVRVRSESKDPWKRLDAGDHDLGARAELDIKGRKSKVTLTRGDDQVTLEGPASAKVRADAAEFVRVDKGHVAGRSSDNDIVIAVPGGTIRLHPAKGGSRADIDVGKKGARTAVTMGKATLKHGDEVEVLRGGESGTLARTGIDVTDRAPTEAHMTLKTPKSATLHAVSVPTNVRIDFREHCARGVVEVSARNNFRKARAREGDGSAIVRLANGRNRYRVRCYQDGVLSKKPAASGRLAVRRDSGSRPLPKGAPKNTIDADGRRYTVLFQNNMPALTFQWPNPPKSSAYVLHVQPRQGGRGKSRQESSSSAKKSFSSGAFVEGAYDYWFSGGGRESKRSQLVISFDNAAATGYVSSPRAGAKLDGTAVRVAGAAVEGWKVSVGGQELRLDRQYRFDQEVPVGPDGIAVRFSHPKYGVHYYLRDK